MTSGWPHFGPRRYPLPEGRVLSVRGTEGRQINMHSLMHIRSRSYAMLSLPFLEGSGVGEGVEEGGENKSPLLVCAMCWKPDAGPGTNGREDHGQAVFMCELRDRALASLKQDRAKKRYP